MPRHKQSRTAVRLSDDERAMMRELCEYHHLTLSALLRQLILVEYRRATGKQVPDPDPEMGVSDPYA